MRRAGRRSESAHASVPPVPGHPSHEPGPRPPETERPGRAALAAGQRAEAELTELLRGDSDRAENERRLAELHRLVAQVHLDAGQKDAAVREAIRLLDTAKRIYVLTPDDRRAGEGVTGAFENLVELEPSKSAEWRERTAVYWQEQSKARPDDLAAAVAAATACIERGELAVAEQKWATALKWFEPAHAELAAAKESRSGRDRDGATRLRPEVDRGHALDAEELDRGGHRLGRSGRDLPAAAEGDAGRTWPGLDDRRAAAQPGDGRLPCRPQRRSRGAGSQRQSLTSRGASPAAQTRADSGWTTT